jgi:hypothetical protein
MLTELQFTNTEIVHPIMDTNEIEELRKSIMPNEPLDEEVKFEQLIVTNKLSAIKGMLNIKNKMAIDRNLFKKIFSYYNPVEIVNNFLDAFPLVRIVKFTPNRFNLDNVDHNNMRIIMQNELELTPITNRMDQCFHIIYRTYNLRIIHGYNVDPEEYPTKFEDYPTTHEYANEEYADEEYKHSDSGNEDSYEDIYIDPESDDLPPNMPVLYRIYRPIIQTLEFRDGKPYQWHKLDIDYDSRQKVNLDILYQYIIENQLAYAAQ